jgi:ATP adenylyltransferase
MESCSFCAEINGENENNFFLQIVRDLPYDDRIILKNDLFCLIPTIGCFIKGYTILVTLKHYDSYSMIDINSLKRIDTILKKIKQFYNRKFQGLTIFEHGCVDACNKAGACYQHSHLHIVPVSLNIDDIPLSNLIRINSIQDLTIFNKTQESYLYLSLSEGDYVAVNPQISSQFMRKIIAKVIGKEDYWNWRKYPFLENMIETKIELIEEFRKEGVRI